MRREIPLLWPLHSLSSSPCQLPGGGRYQRATHLEAALDDLLWLTPSAKGRQRTISRAITVAGCSSASPPHPFPGTKCTLLPLEAHPTSLWHQRPMRTWRLHPTFVPTKPRQTHSTGPSYAPSGASRCDNQIRPQCLPAVGSAVPLPRKNKYVMAGTVRVVLSTCERQPGTTAHSSKGPRNVRG